MICRDQAFVKMWDVCMPQRSLRFVEDLLTTGHCFWCVRVCLCVHIFLLHAFFALKDIVLMGW